jgi:neutral ceramidase
MKRWKKIMLVVVALLLTAIGGCVVVVGPWPVYTSGFEGTPYFTAALAAIERNAAESEATAAPGRLHAGWGVASITPPVGTPLAGFGARRGAASTEIRDDIFVKALALSDGRDTAVLVGADMLIIPNNVADLVRETVAGETSLTANNIVFNATHSHSGPGAFAPGFAGEMTGGKYDPEMPGFLADRFAEAIVQAYRNLEPAALAHGEVDVPHYIKNRTRPGPVDSTAHYLVVRQDDGDQCYMVRYSAHPTVIGAGSLAVSGEFPGYLQRYIESQTGATAIYLGGAVGSMGPQAPEGPDAYARAQAMGEGLAAAILAETTDLEFRQALDVASVGLAFETPPFQARLTPRWRLSPFLPPMLGIDNEAWMGAARVGDILFVGVPADLSGEISRKWQDWGRRQDLAVWALSFNGDYIGYVSPDDYYWDTDNSGGLGYEVGTMSWVGPYQEAYFSALMKHMAEALEPGDT